MFRLAGRERKVVLRQPESEFAGWRMEWHSTIYIYDRKISGSGMNIRPGSRHVPKR
jgi:hypothetical protein